MLRRSKKIWALFRGWHLVGLSAGLRGQEVQMLFCWLQFAIADEKFCGVPVAECTVSIASRAPVAAAAVVKGRGEACGGGGSAVSRWLAQIIDRDGFVQSGFPVRGHLVQAGGQQQQRVDLQAQGPTGPNPLPGV